MTVADTVAPLVHAAVGSEVPLRIRGWDGSVHGPSEAPWQLNLVNRRGLRRLLWAPNDLGFARAYVSGDIDIEGDLLAGLDALERVSDPSRGPGVRIDAQTKKALVIAALRLGIIGPPPKPPAEEAKLARGNRHEKARDAAAISHHYDVGNDFYRLVLGESMTYSCAYWPHHDVDLEQAQFAKCDLVARKLGLRAGMRVLDVGCGWGTFALHAARNYGVQVVGVTLSHEQADYARKRMVEEGVGESVQIRVQDYRDVDDGPYDAISSIGMAEHVGVAMLPRYSADLFALLEPGGRLLNHAISRRPGKPNTFSKTSFIDRYVFPDGEIEPLSTMIEALEGAGFEVRDVESLREHYALTLRAWVANLEANWDQAVRLSSAGRARVWRMYMAGAALSFSGNRLGINQVLAVKCAERGRSGMPATRTELLRSSAPDS
ncbi:cyclopropane-fatty-acyl-phospholipid synthase family protein [Aldersonia sp. NBC_00410]|uniref:SAM-dependent methyltransferase n=1 Tax=Aldersonia sp. NBC_00410 TaxID=2975954 RepID=UPI0022563A98|nr:cyclopropane-fatty-acyl-phospholipid synthase family protein [Aldersonia sp. NBC_00410]MCX5045439.1 cyclopropane-fatty-acyl-phospholipid synthase family protein [Aldersonia sp. NBC_00410]